MPTILLGEDDPGDALLLELALARALDDVSLQFVRDGQEAIDYLQGKGCFADRLKFPLPRMVVLDLKLPLVNGLEVIAWVRRQPSLRQIPIVVLTGSDEPKDMNCARELGANCCFIKPSTSDDLPALVKGLQGQWEEVTGD
jgi:CheY-like chemotaxis protein